MSSQTLDVTVLSDLIPEKDTVIRYPQFDALHAEIQLCHYMSRVSGEPHCIALEGITGAGKSTLVQDYAEAFERSDTLEGTKIPVFYVTVPAAVTVKGLASTMLGAMGDPAADKGTLYQLTARLVGFLKGCEVELVILDEFQHLIDSRTDRIVQVVSDWLKTIIKDAGIPFVVVGIEGEVSRILEAKGLSAVTCRLAFVLIIKAQPCRV